MLQVWVINLHFIENNRLKIIKLLITLSLIFIPIINMISQTSLMDIQLLGLSVVECIEMFLIMAAFVLTIFKTDSSNKKIFWSYMLLLGVYVVFHLFNIYQFLFHFVDMFLFVLLCEVCYNCQQIFDYLIVHHL